MDVGLPDPGDCFYKMLSCVMHLDHLPQVGETYLHLLQNLSLGGAARFAFLYSLSGFFKKVYMAL